MRAQKSEEFVPIIFVDFADDMSRVMKEALEGDPDLVVVRKFMGADACDDMRNLSHDLMRTLPNRAAQGPYFFSFDVLPQNTQTQRIFRTLQVEWNDEFEIDNAFKRVFDQMLTFQRACIIDTKKLNEDNKIVRPQIIHYPTGGGFFDWHEHPRLPTNYGMILNLSKHGRDFNVGATEVVTGNGDVVKLEDHVDIGDLILFKYDLKHRVAPCDPDEDLVFNAQGRWTAILPIY